MDFLKLASTRYSCRKFSERKVEEEKIERILKAGQIAPTAVNFQPQHVYVIKSDDAIEKLKKCRNNYFGEMLALLVAVDRDVCWKRPCDGRSSGDVDAAIVTTHMMLAAWEEGVGSTWVMNFDPEAARAEFALPENEDPVALLVMGYPAEDAAPSDRHLKTKTIDELFTVL